MRYTNRRLLYLLYFTLLYSSTYSVIAYFCNDSHPVKYVDL